MVLRARAAALSLADIGMISVAPPRGISSGMMGSLCKLVAAQALLQVINLTSRGLVVRSMYPDYDLLDGEGNRINHREWRQPVIRLGTRYGTGPGPIDATTWAVNNDVVSVYTTGLNSRFNLKTMLFYAIEDIAIGDDAGNPRPANAHSINFKRGNVKLIDIIDITNIHTRKIIYIQEPVMYKAADETNIQFHLKVDAIGKYDQLKFHALVCETLGATWVG